MAAPPNKRDGRAGLTTLTGKENMEGLGTWGNMKFAIEPPDPTVDDRAQGFAPQEGSE